MSGDEFALHGDGIYCKEDHELLERCEDNNNLDPKHHRIKTELDDFRDIDSDLGREDDSYRWEVDISLGWIDQFLYQRGRDEQCWHQERDGLSQAGLS